MADFVNNGNMRLTSNDDPDLHLMDSVVLPKVDRVRTSEQNHSTWQRYRDPSQIESTSCYSKQYYT